MGLRGAIQAAIAEAKLNQGGFPESNTDPLLPFIPKNRFTFSSLNPPLIRDAWPFASELYFTDSDFGIHAISSSPISFMDQINDTKQKVSNLVLSYPPIVREDKNIEFCRYK